MYELLDLHFIIHMLISSNSASALAPAPVRTPPRKLTLYVLAALPSQVRCAPGWWGERCPATAFTETPSTPPHGWSPPEPVSAARAREHTLSQSLPTLLLLCHPHHIHAHSQNLYKSHTHAHLDQTAPSASPVIIPNPKSHPSHKSCSFP